MFLDLLGFAIAAWLILTGTLIVATVISVVRSSWTSDVRYVVVFGALFLPYITAPLWWFYLSAPKPGERRRALHPRFHEMKAPN